MAFYLFYLSTFEIQLAKKCVILIGIARLVLTSIYCFYGNKICELSTHYQELGDVTFNTKPLALTVILPDCTMQLPHFFNIKSLDNETIHFAAPSSTSMGYKALGVRNSSRNQK